MEVKTLQDIRKKLSKYKQNYSFDKPKLSIIVPSYNLEDYIFDCIKSLITQTLKEIEIIIVDDGSTDNSLNIIKAFEEIDSRIVVISQENHGQAFARNRGLDIAKGEYIGFVDGDDYVDSDYFEKLYTSAKETSSDIALASILKHKPKYNKYNVLYKKSNFAISINDKLKLCSDTKKNFFYVMNRIYKNEFIKENKILFPEGHYYEDVIFSMKAIFYANKIVSVPQINYHYIERKSSTINSNTNVEKKKKDHMLAFAELQNFANEHKFSLPERHRYTNSYWEFKIFKIYKGLNNKKILLFGIIPIYKK